MDFGSNSLWGSFSTAAEPEVEIHNTPQPLSKIPTASITPVSTPRASKIETPSNEPTMSPSEADNLEKWDINDFLGEKGDGCSSGKGCKCPECEMRFAFPGLLEVHRAKMHGVTPIPSCKQCNMVFRRIMGLINHWRTGVPHVKDRDGIKLLGCDICDSFNIINGFKDKDDIAEHTRAVHGQNVLIDSTNFEKPLCPLCQRGFTYRKGVIEHIQILHGEHLVVDLIGAQDPVEQKRLIDELQYRCHYCPKTFRVKKSLLQHLEKFHQDNTGYTQPRPGSPLSTFKAHSVKGNAAPTTSISSAPPPIPPHIPAAVIPQEMPASALKRPMIIQPALPQQPAFPAPNASTSSSKRNPLLPTRQKAPMLPHNSLTVTCHDCGKSFSRQSILNVHSQMVHGAPPSLNRDLATNKAKATNIMNGFSNLQPAPSKKIKMANQNSSAATTTAAMMQQMLTVKQEEEEEDLEEVDEEETVGIVLAEDESMEEDEGEES